MFVYLDNSATTKPYQCVREAVNKVLDTEFGNPSTLYTLGLSAEKIVKAARENVAKKIGASSEEVFFTSCGTESDNTAIFGAYKSRCHQGKRIITTAVEHPAVLRCFEELKRQGADAVFVPVNSDGTFNMDEFKKALTTDTIFVSIMHVNNESGAIFPIEEISKLLDTLPKRPIFHSDCVQSFGKLDIDVKKMGVDMISVSGHKVHAPKGIGALYIKKGLHIPSFVFGGGQEAGFRSGTENMAGIAGFGAALEKMNVKSAAANMTEVKMYLKDKLLFSIDDIKINTPDISAPSVLNVSFLGTRAEVLLHTLEQDEIFVSTGSACSSKSKGSHVLRAMGLNPEEIEGAIRFSFSEDNTKEQMDYVVEKVKAAVESQRMLRSAFHRR
ncbi:MAG: cysteine desulfurase family protein [Bacillota bacterium]|nr:cysteine desulfurase family protein [Bacillota bacterium]